ncbi:hypothetical protein KM043_015343 [Ampulex compressa]|nr:hypothetical protein KM043_015343 [Ampulex compressa]
MQNNRVGLPFGEGKGRDRKAGSPKHDLVYGRTMTFSKDPVLVVTVTRESLDWTDVLDSGVEANLTELQFEIYHRPSEGWEQAAMTSVHFPQ